MTDPAYEQYLLQKHSKFNTDTKVISNLVHKAVASKAVSIERVIQGEVNEVYQVTTDNDLQVIVRISRSKKPRFETEQKYINLCRNNNVPAPEILLVERMTSDDGDKTFCIQKKIEGATLLSLIQQPGYDFNSKEYKYLLHQAGSVLSKIHSVPTDIFGTLADDDDQEPTWQGYVYQVIENKKRLYDVATLIDLNLDAIENSFELLKKGAYIYKKIKPCLLHGDYGFKHMLVQNNNIVGVIDFEACKGGDPVFDLAWLNYFYKDEADLNFIIDGYEQKELLSEDFDLRLKSYRILLSLELLDYYESEKNVAGITHTKAKLLSDIESYSS